jgi:PPOX class probable F420-dependent enzyme
MLSEEQARFLTDPNPAILTTLRADGSAHSTLIWIDWDGEYVLINTVAGRTKERHLRRDNRITVAVVNPNNFDRYITLEGRAEFTTEGAVEQVNRLCNKYRGHDFVHTPGVERMLVRFRPERVYGIYDDEREVQEKVAIRKLARTD